MSYGYYSQQMPYLEDIGREETREVECVYCEHEADEQEGTHYLDSETFRWECSHCLMFNEVSAPVEEPDPDEAYDRMREEQIFGI